MRTVQVEKTFRRPHHVVPNSPNHLFCSVQFDIVPVVVYPVRNNNGIRPKCIDCWTACKNNNGTTTLELWM